MPTLVSLESANTSSQEFTWLRKPVKIGFVSRWVLFVFFCGILYVKHCETSHHKFSYRGKPLAPGLEMPWYLAEARKSWAKGCCLYITSGPKEVAGVSWYCDVVQGSEFKCGLKLETPPTPQVHGWCYGHHPHGFQRDSTAWCGRYDA